MTFTPEQLDAIARREGPLLLSAAAGSGKTSVLVERFVRMVTDDGIAPDRILVITFTEKAAGELRSRIRAELLARGRRDLARDAEAAWISTFHGFCARVLRSHAIAAGLDPGFAVLDEAAGRELRGAAFEEALAGLLGPVEAPPRTEALDLVAAYGADRLERAVLDVYGQLRSAGQERPVLPPAPPAADPAPLLERLRAAGEAALAWLGSEGGTRVEAARAAIARLGEFKAGNAKVLQGEPCGAYLAAWAEYETARVDAEAARALALIDELLGRYADAYAALKHERSAVDFDDLELVVARVFDEQAGLAAAWAGRFDRIMVDEFQDTNAVQVALLDRLDSGHTFYVGDELQSIYGFRHASVEVFRAKQDALAATGAVGELTVNFRSRPELIAAINRAGAELHPHAAPLVAAREGGAGPLVELLITDAPNGSWDEQELGALPGGPAWRWAEARLLAARIAELVADGVPPSDIVVLVRAATDLACYERAIEDHGISTLASGGRGFWARQQVQDLTQYLAALANPRDEAALLGVLASPLGPALPADELATLALGARTAGHGLWRFIDEGGHLADWREAFVAERARAPRLSLAELLRRAVDRSGYEQHVLRLPGGVRRLANVRKLIRLAEAYERESGRHVRGFIDRATAELEAEAREPDAPVELAGLEAVRLMTIHAAKGLEFPVVAVADLGRPPNATLPDVLVEGDRVGLRLVTLHGKAKTATYEELAARHQQREREEMLRVFHVAVTRAQERLLLSGALNVEKWPLTAPAGWLLAAFGGASGVDGAVTVRVNRPGETRLLPATVLDVRRHATNGQHDPALARAAAPPPPPPVSTLSYSALSNYAQCGYRFYLERVLRLPPQDAPPLPGEQAPTALDPLTRGSIAHTLLEHTDLSAPQPPDDATIAEAAVRHQAELTTADLADLYALVHGAVNSELMQRIAAATERHKEEPFALALTAPEHAHIPLFTGFLDVRAIEADGTALVVDYKTDRLDGRDPEDAVQRAYGVQRRLYALAALRAGAPRAEVAHLFLERPSLPATARYEAADVPRLEAEIAEQSAGVMSGRFDVAAAPHRELCATCPGRGGLCSWPEETTLQTLAES